MANELNADTVRELLHYDPDTGALTWRPRDRRWFKTERSYKMWNSRYAGKPAGSYHTQPGGYRYHHVQVLGHPYKAGRLVWLYMTGDWPQGMIDHVDRDPCNQEWSNLRDVTVAQNNRNASVRAQVGGRGYPGVSFRRQSGTWQAQIGFNGERAYLGCHKTLLDAVAARKRAEREYGFSPGHGQPRPERSISNG